jgi:hypothetical protein
MDERLLRRHLSRLLEWGEARVTFEAAVRKLPPRLRGVVPEGLPHSAWQLVEHIRLAQADILEFCGPSYKDKRWPDDYWPSAPGPKRADAWKRSIAAVRRDRRTLQRLVMDRSMDLLSAVPSDPEKTYLRSILLIADHTAYHVGQLVLVRRALGAWPD